MSTYDVEKQLETLENVKIRGRLNIEDLARRQIDRCNITMGGLDESVFEANVRALMMMLPENKRQEVMGKGKLYNENTEEYMYDHCAGVQMGTPGNPIVRYYKYPQYDFLKDHPGWEDMEEELDYDIISPKLQSNEATDYEKLYSFVVLAFQEVGLTWDIEPRTVDLGPVAKSKVPRKVLDMAEDAVVDIILEMREDHRFLSFDMVIEELRKRNPAQPLWDYGDEEIDDDPDNEEMLVV